MGWRRAAWSWQTTTLIALTLLALPPARHVVAQVPPNVRWRTLEGEHTRVTFGPDLEPLALRALDSAERAHAVLRESLTRAPAGRVDIVLTDNVDFSNGFATPFPSNRIVIYARPPVDDEALVYNGNWLDLVISHEMAHVFHLDRTGGFGRAIRTVFGRLPLLWPTFPATGTPGWSIEGLAVTIESAFTGYGRAHGSYHEMIVRTAILENRFERMDRLNESSPIWPGNARIYIYGSLFLDWIEQRYGEGTNAELVDRTASAFLPPVLFFDHVARRAFDASFDEAYEEWRAHLQAKYTRLADSLRAQGLTSAERITAHGRWALFPRVSPDGGRVAYAAETGTDVTETRIVDVSNGTVDAQRANGLGVLSWTPDGTAIVRSGFEYDGQYRVLRDLERIGQSPQSLTRHARVEHPDVASDGERIVTIQNAGGTNRIIIVRMATDEVEPVTDFVQDVHWAYPRFSPDGSRIAASRIGTDGTYDIVVLATNGQELVRLTRDAAIDLSPAWSPDGRWIVFSSDRSGIANLYAADISDLARPQLRQITNVLTGAFHPDVSADSRWIYFSGYGADGFSIERMPFDPATWRDPSPVRLHGQAAEGMVPAGTLAGTEVRPYSPVRSLLPQYWEPAGGRISGVGTFLGASSSGRDLVGRHAWAALAAIDVDGSGRWAGGIDYRWAGLGNPVLSFEASRDWDRLGSLRAPDSTIRVAIEREDVLAAFMTLVRRRWRGNATISIGVEREWARAFILGTPRYRFTDERDGLWSLVARTTFANARVPAYAISRENGITVALEATSAIESDDEDVPRDYTEFELFSAAYRSLPFQSFAHHVLAARFSALVRNGEGARPTSIGGESGGAANLFGYNVGSGSRLLPLRGFDRGVLIGTRAWTATLEYRLPIALIGRRPALSPFFLDRIAAAAFLDMGDAECSAAAADIFTTCARAAASPGPLLGAGAELVADIGFAGIFPARLRAGFAVPVRGPDESTRFYLVLGPNF
jgi:Tol biopolymer transport system component